MAVDYAEFLQRKGDIGTYDGFEPVWMPDFLYPFQRDVVDWSIRKGKAAEFGDCGLGKTPMQLVFAENVVRHTNKPVLIITPLAVSAQTIREGEKFGIEVRRSIDGTVRPGINVTNYERLQHFNPADFIGAVCDESSAIKDFAGQRQKIVTDFMHKLPYRLLCTATASPNDYIELGTSAEALGQLGRMDMLSMFFKNDENSNHPIWWGARWRFKAHAEQRFWRWVVSWARAFRKPSDLGYPNDGFILPPLIEDEHVVRADKARAGCLFDMPAVTLDEQREERRLTMDKRCELTASLVNNTGQPAVVWCHLNPEGDLLTKLIPDAVQIAGNNTDDEKEDRFLRFAEGKIRVLVTKPKIGALGLNWQHCNHMTFFPSHSFEQYYQGVRRCWRFGQQRPVKVDIVTSEGELGVMKNLQRKAAAADKMFSILVEEVRNEMAIDRRSHFDKPMEAPKWLLQTSS